jgi:hypothetical protein
LYFVLETIIVMDHVTCPSDVLEKPPTACSKM